MVLCRTNISGRASIKLTGSKSSLWSGLVIICTTSYILISFLHLTKTSSRSNRRFQGVANNYLKPARMIPNVTILVPNVVWSQLPIKWNKYSAKWVVIISYQRSGSSFFGSLFNFDPDAFYVYEPLDGLYTSMYGTVPGWNVPSDIVSYWNGSQREIPEHEHRSVAGFLQNLFQCDVTSLPTLSLTSPLWSARYQKELGYWSCLSMHHTNRYDRRNNLRSVCPSRFDASDPALERCRLFLNDSSNLAIAANYFAADRKRYVAEKLSRFSSSLKAMRRTLERGNCLQILKNKCVKGHLRVAKLVRGTMKSMRFLLETNPHLSIIHLVRDPRAVALSRMKFHPSGRGLHSKRGRTWWERLSREAVIYCRQVVADVVVRRQLEHLFPGRLLAVNYEQVVDDPVSNAEKIYRFLGLPVPEVVVQKFTQLTLIGNKNVTGKSLATKWKENLNAGVREAVDGMCVEMLNLYPQYSETS